MEMKSFRLCRRNDRIIQTDQAFSTQVLEGRLLYEIIHRETGEHPRTLAGRQNMVFAGGIGAQKDKTGMLYSVYL